MRTNPTSDQQHFLLKEKFASYGLDYGTFVEYADELHQDVMGLLLAALVGAQGYKRKLEIEALEESL